MPLFKQYDQLKWFCLYSLHFFAILIICFNQEKLFYEGMMLL